MAASRVIPDGAPQKPSADTGRTQAHPPVCVPSAARRVYRFPGVGHISAVAQPGARGRKTVSGFIGVSPWWCSIAKCVPRHFASYNTTLRDEP